MTHTSRYNYALWGILILFCLVISIAGNKRTVSVTYQTAALNWIEGKDLYTEAKNSGRGYLYLPQAAILYAPFAILPFKISELLWRLFSIGFLMYALWKMSELHGDAHQAQLFLLATLIMIPMGFSCFRNGQMNMMLTSLGLLSVISAIKQQWNWTALSLLFGLCLKPLMAVLLLLMGGLYPSIRWRLFFGLFAVFLLPFATKNFHYVISQYTGFYETLISAKQLGVEKISEWRQLFSFLIEAFDLVLSAKAQLIIRLTAAVTTLWLCYVALKKKNIITANMIILGLSVCYLLLFNPRTESNSYIILAPSLAYFAYSSLNFTKDKLLFFITIGLVITFILAQTSWQKVIPTIIFTALLIYRIFSKQNEA